MKRNKNYLVNVVIIVLFSLSAFAITTDMDLYKEHSLDGDNIKDISYFYNQDTSEIVLYFWDGSSALVYSGLSVIEKIQGDTKVLYVTILSKLGFPGLKNDERFRKCKNSNWIICFQIKNFDIKKTVIIYKSEAGEKSLPFKGVLDNKTLNDLLFN